MEKIEPTLDDCMNYFSKYPDAMTALEAIVFKRLWLEEKAKNKIEPLE